MGAEMGDGVGEEVEMQCWQCGDGGIYTEWEVRVEACGVEGRAGAFCKGSGAEGVLVDLFRFKGGGVRRGWPGVQKGMRSRFV